MLKCFGCKRNTGKKRNTVPNLPPGVFNIIGKKLSNRNAVALALASKGVHEVLSPNLARRKMAEFHGPRAYMNYKFYHNVLNGIQTLRNTTNKGNANVRSPLTNENLNALRHKVLQNIRPMRNNTFRNEGINFIWRLNNNTHLYGWARLINGRLPYEAFDIFVYKRQPNGTYAKYNMGGYLNRRTAPGHGGRRI